MPYRRTEKVSRRLAERRAAILSAARDLAVERGLSSVQIASVADRAGVAAGTMYRYFSSKTELISALITDVESRELLAIRGSADSAPGPLSALAAALTTFAARFTMRQHLALAVGSDATEASVEHLRRDFRRALADEIAMRIEAAIASGYLPEQDSNLSGAALIGAAIEGLSASQGTAKQESYDRDAIRAVCLLGLRAVGVADARARGLVVQADLRA